MSKRKRTAHSEFFVNIIGRKENALAFIKRVLPEGVQNQLLLDTLTVEKDTYVDEKLKDHFSDLVFSVKLKNGRLGKIYCLVEHKSAPEYLVALQLVRYMALEWNEMYKQGQIFNHKLPPIIPIVVYQGLDDWAVSQNFQNIVDFPSDDFKAYIPDFQYALWNFIDVDENQLQESLVLKYYVLICKALASPKLPDYIFDLVEAFVTTLDRRTAIEYIEIFFSYLVRSSGRVSRETFEKALIRLPEGGEKIMNTLAEQWKTEGRQEILQQKDKWISDAKSEAKSEGKLENSQEMLIEYLQDELDIPSQTLIGKIRSIKSYDVLRGLFRKARKVSSLDEFAKELDKVLT